ncbi:uncharacterized protein [Dendrobates tinctorius]|uniref:uncharacterized protein isoform X2 n=1 Tax=Dendrobates tinctorius TaxID=92724 RepID=UPI003CCA406A
MYALNMEKELREDAGLFAPFAGSLSPILFSEEDGEYDSLNSADRRENTFVLLKNDRSPDHRVSSDYVLSSSTTGSRTYSPSCSESEEETELTYNSPTPLLEISSSSSSTRIPEENNSRDNNEKQSLGLEYWAKPSSDYSSESECGNSDPQSIPDFISHENSPSLRILPHDQPAVGDFTYTYENFSAEMVQAVHILRYPVEMNKWAVEYLSQQDIRAVESVSQTSDSISMTDSFIPWLWNR